MTAGSGLTNIVDAGYGVDVTGKIATTDGMDIDIGGSINAAGTSIDFQNTTISFTGATIGGLDSSDVNLANISDASYGVLVQGKIATSGIDVGSGTSINAALTTVDFQGATINFGSSIIMGGNAFKDTINNHIWAGSTEPTDGHVLSWNASLLSGAGDYEWIAPSSGGGTAYDQSLNTTDDVDFASVTTQALTVTGVGDTTITSGADVQLDSPNRVGVLNSPFRLAHMTNAERDAIIAQDGDMIYNVEDLNFQVYTQGSWFRLSRYQSYKEKSMREWIVVLEKDIDYNAFWDEIENDSPDDGFIPHVE